MLLSYGFINALVEKQRLESLRDYLKPRLADYFGAALAVDSDDAGVMCRKVCVCPRGALSG